MENHQSTKISFFRTHCVHPSLFNVRICPWSQALRAPVLVLLDQHVLISGRIFRSMDLGLAEKYENSMERPVTDAPDTALTENECST